MSVSAKRLRRRKIGTVSFTNSNQYGFLKRIVVLCSDNVLLRQHYLKAFIIFLIPQSRGLRKHFYILLPSYQERNRLTDVCLF